MRIPTLFYTTSYPQVVPLNQYSFTGGNVSAQITAFGDQREATPYIGTGYAKNISDY
jgi:hypothetical protein